MAQIFYQSFGQKGTLAIWSIVVIVQSAIIRSTPHYVTNGPPLQVHDGVKHGECCLRRSQTPKRRTYDTELGFGSFAADICLFSRWRSAILIHIVQDEWLH